MNKIKLTIAAVLTVLGIGTAPLVLSTSVHADAADEIGKGAQQTGGSSNGTDLKTYITTITNVLLFVLGAIAVIMIIIGGIRYTTSNGDASQTKSAKDTVLYAVVGVVVALLSYAIVNFIVNQAFKS